MMNLTSILDSIAVTFNESDSKLLWKIISTVLITIAILLIFNIIKEIVAKSLKKSLKEQQSFMLKKIIQYTGFAVAILFALRNLGIDINAILGAAGILGVVVGFAAQTSVSNFISGLFLLSEKPFTVGDAIQVDAISGVVLSVDLLSVKIRTWDNLYVRIPNQNILQNSVTTLTKYQIRKLDINITISYKEDLEHVRDILMSICQNNTLVLESPAPYFRVDKFSERGIDIIVGAWADRGELLNLKTQLFIEIKKRFTSAKIEIPFQYINVSIAEAQHCREAPS
jgi:small-conductance mechanosensitive channel